MARGNVVLFYPKACDHPEHHMRLGIRIVFQRAKHQVRTTCLQIHPEAGSWWLAGSRDYECPLALHKVATRGTRQDARHNAVALQTLLEEYDRHLMSHGSPVLECEQSLVMSYMLWQLKSVVRSDDENSLRRGKPKT